LSRRIDFQIGGQIEFGLVNLPDHQAVRKRYGSERRTGLLAANHQLIHDGIGILAITPDKKTGLKEFIDLLIPFYETGDETNILPWLREHAMEIPPSGFTLADRKSR
jgi:hypothetical protein